LRVEVFGSASELSWRLGQALGRLQPVQHLPVDAEPAGMVDDGLAGSRCGRARSSTPARSRAAVPRCRHALQNPYGRREPYKRASMLRGIFVFKKLDQVTSTKITLMLIRLAVKPATGSLT
jgi:hypothetical protein